MDDDIEVIPNIEGLLNSIKNVQKKKCTTTPMNNIKHRGIYKKVLNSYNNNSTSNIKSGNKTKTDSIHKTKKKFNTNSNSNSNTKSSGINNNSNNSSNNKKNSITINPDSNTNRNTPLNHNRYKSALERLNTSITLLNSEYKRSLRESIENMKKFELTKNKANILQAEKFKNYSIAFHKKNTLSQNLKNKEQLEKNKAIKQKIISDKEKEKQLNYEKVQLLRMKENQRLENIKNNLYIEREKKTKFKNERKMKLKEEINKEKIRKMKDNKLKIKSIKDMDKLIIEKREKNEEIQKKKMKKELEDKIKLINLQNLKLNRKIDDYLRISLPLCGTEKIVV